MYKTEDIRKDTYPYNQSFLDKYPFMLTSFKSDNLPMIVLDSEEIDLIFDLAINYYRKLRRLKVLEDMKWGITQLSTDVVQYSLSIANIALNCIPAVGQLASLIISLVQLGLEIIHTFTKKFWEYPDYINELYFVIKMFVTWAKISDGNKQELLSGVTNYIEMQKEEFNDFVHEEGYAELDELSIMYIMDNYLPAFKARVKKVMRKSGKDLSQAIPDINKTAPGKDDTNEIDFARNPQEENPQEKREHSNENEGKILDTMRNRQSKERAGSNHYDYEYSKRGFNIKLEKAQEIDITKDLAQEAAVAQVVKGGVLALCSLHYCKRYKATNGFNDICEVKAHIPTDMQAQEINPSIKRFNNQMAHKQLKDSQNRYKEGYQPKITHYLKLDVIDESIDRYYRDYMNLYSQLSEESKLKFGFVELTESKEAWCYSSHICKEKTQGKRTPPSNEEAKKIIENYTKQREIKQKEFKNTNKRFYLRQVNLSKTDLTIKKYEFQAVDSVYADSNHKVFSVSFDSEGFRHTQETKYFYVDSIATGEFSIHPYEVEEKWGGGENGWESEWVIYYCLLITHRVTLKHKIDKGILQNEIGKITTQLASENKDHGLPQNTTDKNLDNLIQNGML
ncbi:hypothetical protein [Helicobacter bilis]|uniref:hypothetical protein n=1 Tax=Helicobacter bilis TaxID=37372 RepID=UPI00248E0E24|nr:hypothetical protein [Helicobacter bilis]